ncbi:MAG: DUF177 domain-containing protein [Bacteroidales bacterium]|nr:DUF177 domain-containing protein [Bacteroidales bacterium]
MKKRGTYAVRISGLGDGDHDFSFELDKKFFDSFEQPDIENGKVQARVILEKKHGVITLHFSFTGEVEVVCDRCLESFMTGINTVQKIFVKPGDAPGEIEDDVVMIGKDDHEIEVGQFMYEFIVLALPFKRIHPLDEDENSTCNEEMLKNLDAHRARSLDQNDQTDPRWDALKGIIEKSK